MYLGVRRFVILDFGRFILLIDVLIFICGDLVFLLIDIWILGEEVDGRWLVVVIDISIYLLIFYDLILFFVCRFMKIIVIGCYGSINVRVKILLGFYYGYIYILFWESELKLMYDFLKGEGEFVN